MQYFVSIGSGEDALVRQISFEGEGSELVVLLRRGEENFATEHRFRIDHVQSGDARELHLLVDSKSMDFHLRATGHGYEIQFGTELVDVKVVDERELVTESLSSDRQTGPCELRAAMPGVVVSVDVAKGDEVLDGQTLLVLEAMKMQNALPAPIAGTVKALPIVPGTQVAKDDVLAIIAT